ncbi:MAG: toll/interleukin-1 receptor domain-containing protein [Candidatus Acidiferrales bacterium]
MSRSPSAPALPKEIFLSHSSRDRAFVGNLTKVLRRHGIGYWYSATHIVGAKQWHDEIGRALGRCDWFLVVLSPESVRSKWVKRELLHALNEDRYDEKIVPLLRKPCRHSQLSWTLSEFQFVDFTGDFDAGCRQLLRIWNLSYQSPTRFNRGTRKS